MKLNILFIVILFLPFMSISQNLPACDSLVIDCCSFNTITPNSVSINVSNYSSNLFSYPGFIMFDTNMDTVAIETVNYFGIGWDQVHTLNIINPIGLPFEGILELHTGFYDSLVCTYPVVIQDTTLTIVHEVERENIEVFPNPVVERLTISNIELQEINSILINNMNGRLLQKINAPVSKTIDVSELSSGVYIILYNDNNGNIYRSKFIKQ